MARKRSIEYEVTADSTGFKRSLQDANTAFDRFSRSAKKRTDQLANSFKLVTVGVGALTAGVAAYGAAAAKLTSDVAKQSDEITSQAQALGVTTDGYQELTHAMSKFGVSSGRVEKTLARTTKAIMGGVSGSQKYASAFEKIGLSAESLRAMAPDKAFEEMRAAISGLDDPMERLTVAQALFGENTGRILAPALAESEEAFSSLREEAHLFGLVLGGDALEASSQYNDSMFELKSAVSGVATQVGAVLLPIMTDLLGALAPMVKRLTESSDELLMLKVVTMSVAEAVAYMAGAVGVLVDWLGVATRKLGEFAAWSGRATKAVGSFAERIPFIGKGLKDVGDAAGTIVEHSGLGIGMIGDMVSGVGEGVKKVSADVISSIDSQKAKLKELSGQAEETSEKMEDAFSGGRGGGRGGKGAAVSAAKKIDPLIAVQKRYLGLIETNADKLAAGFDELNQLMDAGLLTTDQYAASVEYLREKYDDATIAAAELSREAERLTESMRTDEERRAESAARYEELFEAGLIDLETYKRAMDSLREVEDVSAEVTEAVVEQWSDAGSEIEEFFASSVGDVIFSTITEGVESAADAIKNLAAQLAAMAAESAIMDLFQGSGPGAAGGVGGGGGFLQGFLNSLPGFATGGRIHGPGSRTSDSILARLSRDEYVINAAAARAIGYDTLDKMNSVRRGGRTGGGGYAGGGRPTSGIPGSVVNIINVTDPSEIEAAMSGKAGEEVIFNAISRARPQIRRLLGVR